MKINKGDTRYVYIAPDMWFAEWKIIRPVSNSTLGYRGVLFEIVQRKKDKPKFCIAEPLVHFNNDELEITWTSWYWGKTVKDIMYRGSHIQRGGWNLKDNEDK